MLFGKRLHMTTFLIAETPEVARKHPETADFFFPGLGELAEALQGAINP